MTTDPELLTGLGAALAIFLSATGSAMASAHSGTFAMRGHHGMKDFVPIVISGVLAIYGIIVAVLLCGKYTNDDDDDAMMTAADGYRNLSAGLSVGLACFASGSGIASFVRQCNENSAYYHNNNNNNNGRSSLVGSVDTEPLLSLNGNTAATPTTFARPCFIKLCMVLVFLEAIGLYGLIVALVLIG